MSNNGGTLRRGCVNPLVRSDGFFRVHDFCSAHLFCSICFILRSRKRLTRSPLATSIDVAQNILATLATSIDVAQLRSNLLRNVLYRNSCNL